MKNLIELCSNLMKVTAIIVVISLLLGGCNKNDAASLQEDYFNDEIINVDINNTVQIVDAKDTNQNKNRTISESNNQFALDLYLKFSEKEGNIFFSPWSISVALAMAYEGARGQTADEIASVFYFKRNDSARRSEFSSLNSQFNRKDVQYKLHIANAFWVQQDFMLLPQYVGILEKYYQGKATNVNFKEETEKSRQTINIWIENKTNNKIKDFFQKGVLSESTRLVLTNVIYFKGDWVKAFNKKETTLSPFRATPETIVQVPMMSRTDLESRFKYLETGILQILEMPYKGENLSMLVLLPKNDDLREVEQSLNLENLSQWKEQLHEERVDVYMPKFTFDTKYSLSGTLKEMGINSAFDGDAADFSGIHKEAGLMINAIIHQAFVDVNEEGTEAAAATGVVFGFTGSPPSPPVFRADHPFIFIIQERQTGTILFLGRVTNPLG